MATLSALRFSSPDGAERATVVVEELTRSGALKLEDAAIVRWPASRTRPEMKRLNEMVADAGLNDTFWSTLFSLLLLLPLAAREGGLDPDRSFFSLADFGISNDFVRQVRQRVHQGTSALFLLTPHATVDRVIDSLQSLEFTASSTNLTHAQCESLRAAFSDHPRPGRTSAKVN